MGSEKLHEDFEGPELRSIKLDEFRPWLSSSESGLMVDHFRKLLRFGEMLELLLERFDENRYPFTKLGDRGSSPLDFNRLYVDLAFDAGRRLSNTLLALRKNLTQHDIRFESDEVADLVWRSLKLHVEEAASIADRIHNTHILAGTDASNDSKPQGVVGATRRRKIVPDYQDENAAKKKSDSRNSQDQSLLHDSSSEITSATTRSIEPHDLLRMLQTMNTLIGAIAEQFELVSSWSTSTPRINRLGLSEIQIEILRTLHPDKLLNAFAIAENLGVPLNDRGVVPFVGQLKPEGALRRQGLIETQRGPEGGYFLTEYGREVYEEYAGLDMSAKDADRSGQSEWSLLRRAVIRQLQRQLSAPIREYQTDQSAVRSPTSERSTEPRGK